MAGFNVTLGGAFLYAADPAALAAWYKEKLGLPLTHTPGENCFNCAWTEGGCLVWAVMPRPAGHTAGSSTAMVNYRVTGLAALLEHLKAGGVPIEKTETHVYGTFAWVKDPEGNRLEMWEEAAAAE